VLVISLGDLNRITSFAIYLHWKFGMSPTFGILIRLVLRYDFDLLMYYPVSFALKRALQLSVTLVNRIRLRLDMRIAINRIFETHRL
jgi:hypothetical protein